MTAMGFSAEALKDVFVPPGHVSEKDFTNAVSLAAEFHTSIEEQLVNRGYVTDYQVGKTIADAFEFEFCDLTSVTLDDRFLDYIPEIVARAQQAVVFEETEDELHVATLQPANFEFQKLLEKKFGKKVRFSYTSVGALAETLRLYKGDYQERIEALITKCSENQSEGEVVAFVDLLLEYGYESKASDIHIEPLAEQVRIRFRIDGALHEVASYPAALHNQVSFRIKILSRLQTDEHGKAQDGRIDITTSIGSFDLRVSIIPVTNGENIVMRILSSYVRQFTLDTLGFSARDHEKVLKALKQPHGMILAVGPTGSGKTTVLYTILERLNTPDVNIMTIEDPVEYDINNVQQTQVNKSKNLVFSTGLRSIVRQDPDIIMVGEIRDEETADIAVNAALTGHLLLSTLHTNDAATTFPRLMEMGVESFLIASSVRVIISLRLVRTICVHCKQSYFLTKEETDIVESQPKVLACIQKMTNGKPLSEIRFFRGAGCSACHKSGFSGRSAIFEVLEADTMIRLLVTKGATSDEIHAAAVEAGMTPLLHDGVLKALAGQTTIQEVIKAAYS